MCLYFPLFLLVLFLCIYYTFLFKTVKDTSVCDCVSELWVIYRFLFFSFSPIDYSFPKSLHLAFFTPPSFSEDVSYVCCRVIFFCHISHCILESLNFLSDFLKSAYFRIYFFAVSFYIF